jgi:hypothetical protein
MPLKFSWARADRSLKRSCTASKRRRTCRPRKRNRAVATGRMAMVTAVRRGLTASMKATELPTITTVWKDRIRPTPANRCTARTSLTARAMRSPVRQRWKKLASIRSRCANSASLSSASIRKAAPRICQRMA